LSGFTNCSNYFKQILGKMVVFSTKGQTWLARVTAISPAIVVEEEEQFVRLNVTSYMIYDPHDHEGKYKVSATGNEGIFQLPIGAKKTEIMQDMAEAMSSIRDPSKERKWAVIDFEAFEEESDTARARGAIGQQEQPWERLNEDGEEALNTEAFEEAWLTVAMDSFFESSSAYTSITTPIGLMVPKLSDSKVPKSQSDIDKMPQFIQQLWIEAQLTEVAGLEAVNCWDKVKLGNVPRNVKLK
jgi:hypothetical protein